MRRPEHEVHEHGEEGRVQAVDGWQARQFGIGHRLRNQHHRNADAGRAVGQQHAAVAQFGQPE